VQPNVLENRSHMH